MIVLYPIERVLSLLLTSYHQEYINKSVQLRYHQPAPQFKGYVMLRGLPRSLASKSGRLQEEAPEKCRFGTRGHERDVPRVHNRHQIPAHLGCITSTLNSAAGLPYAGSCTSCTLLFMYSCYDAYCNQLSQLSQLIQNQKTV